MTRPLHKGVAQDPKTRSSDGHAGLWFDKFCDQWRVEDASWTLKSKKGDDRNNPKLEWINTVTDSTVGTARQLDEYALRLTQLVEKRGGRLFVFVTESRFVTGLGRSHPVENGFAWHPTLGTPYLPGSSIKGLVRAWAEQDAAPRPACETVKCLLGDPGEVGQVCFLDAAPIGPVRLEADVMTPHYAGWTVKEPPGDWCSPTPIPFLTTAAKTAFLFGVIPCRSVSEADLDTVGHWLNSALVWTGGGAKTAVGYGRFERCKAGEEILRRNRAEREDKPRQEREALAEARDRELRLAALTPIEREIEQLLDDRQDKNVPASIAILKEVEAGRWSDDDKLEVAKWLEVRMTNEKRWRETSEKKNPAKDRDHQRTLRVMDWLSGK